MFQEPLPYMNALVIAGGLAGLVGLKLYGKTPDRPYPHAHAPVLEAIRDGVLVLDTQDKIADFNGAAQAIFPLLSNDLLGKPAAELLRPLPQLLDFITADVSATLDLKLERDNFPQYYSCRVTPMKDAHNRLIGKTLVLTETTDQVLLMTRLKTLATVDCLTGISNRAHVLEISRREFQLAIQQNEPASLIILDLDHFKAVNDTYGHPAGDAVLKAVATVCQNSLRALDVFGRYGGEEFVVFLPSTPPKIAYQIAERLRQNIAKTTILLNGAGISVTASLGVAGLNVPTAATELDALFAAADQALYRAKKMGRNCTVLSREAPWDDMPQQVLSSDFLQT